jgi:hypothetical protein
VNYSIVHYAFTTVLYRLSVQDYGMSCAATLLLPDFLTVIMMCLLHFDKIIAAFFLLLGSMFCLGVFVLASTIRLLWIVPSSTASADDDMPDLQQLQDELAVTF